MSIFKKNKQKVLAIVFLGSVVLCLFWLSQKQFAEKQKKAEIFAIEQKQDFVELSKKVKRLAEKKGPEYTYDLLLEAKLPEGVDMHLLGHTVGDVLYKQAGKDGLSICTDDFRNACAHSIVIGMFMNSGTEAINEINEVCKKAPGGKGAYFMCFHGLGHGVLAFSGYDFEAAVDLCKMTGTKKHIFAESAECVSGAVMEMVSGVHDVELWSLQKDKYLKKSDPLYLCMASFMPEEAKYQCIKYLTPYIMESTGVDLNNPLSESYAKAFKTCEVNDLSESLKTSCYGGFGKEFVGIAAKRDIQNLDEISDDGLQNIVKWCGLAENNFGFEACIREAENSLYWGGENSYMSSVRLCRQIDDLKSKNSCFDHLLGMIKHYRGEFDYIASFCDEVIYDYPSCQ